MAVFSFKNLIPDFCQLPVTYVEQVGVCEDVVPVAAQGVSALIVALLIVISLGFLLVSIINFIRSKHHIRFYFKLLSGLTQTELAKQRNEIRTNATRKEYFGRLWKEFDESLVMHKDSKGDYRLSNTLDAAHFFNTHSLARGLTENRLLAAVPGLLTAIGVIGTFAGLQMGLAGIDLSSDEIGPLKEGIGNMIKGASIAFLTSLWGIALSVAFNLSEKAMERSVRGQIGSLQNHIDFLYPRLTAEQSLVEIADTSKTGAETMQGLAEKIGSKMQEAMAAAGDAISSGLKESLHEILSPALEKMAMDAQTGSEKALESMLERFMDGFGQAGTDQREMMDNSSKEVQQAIGQLGTEMNGFITKLDERSSEVDEKNRLQREHLESTLKTYEEDNNTRQQAMASQFTNLMDEMTKGTNDQLEQQRQRDHERMQSFKVQLDQATKHQKSSLTSFTDAVSTQLEEQRALDVGRNERANKQIDSMQASQEGLEERLQELIAYQKKSHDQLYEELTNLQQGFKEVTTTNRQAAQDIKMSSEKMQLSTVQLSSLGGKLNESSEALGSMVDRAVSSTNDLVQKNIDSVNKLETVLNHYQQFASEVTRTTETLKQAAEHADSGFSHVDQHLQAFEKALKQQTSDMQQQMQKLMTHFAEQVRAQTVERMQVWTDETSKYNHVMTKAINTIADLVDDIEGKFE